MDNGVRNNVRVDTNLAAFYIAWGRYGKAEELLVSGLEPMRRVMGYEHPQTLKMVNNLAWLYLKQGRYERAEEGLLENFEVKQRVLGELHPSTVETLLNLVLLYDEMEADDRYEEYLARYLERLRRVCEGPTARTRDRIDYANLLLSTADVVGLRNPEEALSVALEAVGETGREDVGALAVLSRAYEQVGDLESAAATAREALALAVEESEVRSQMEEILRRATGESSDTTASVVFAIESGR